MKFNELPMEIQEQLNSERDAIKGKCINTPYEIHIYNADGTRYFYAHRVSISWNDDKGNYMPFGGGSYWEVRYGVVQIEAYKNPIGQRDYRLCYGRTFGKSMNGTIIPKRINKKKDVLAIIKSIGIFNL